MYSYVYIYMCVCVYVCARLWSNINIYIYISINIYLNIYIYMCVCIFCFGKKRGLRHRTSLVMFVCVNELVELRRAGGDGDFMRQACHQAMAKRNCSRWEWTWWLQWCWNIAESQINNTTFVVKRLWKSCQELWIACCSVMCSQKMKRCEGKWGPMLPNVPRVSVV